MRHRITFRMEEERWRRLGRGKWVRNSWADKEDRKETFRYKEEGRTGVKCESQKKNVLRCVVPRGALRGSFCESAEVLVTSSLRSSTG